MKKGKHTIPSFKTGEQVELDSGMIIESEESGAKTPLLVFARQEEQIGKDDHLIEYRVAGKDHVALSRWYTAFQLERYGYKVTGKVKKLPAITEPDSKLVVELVDVHSRAGSGKATAVIKSIKPNQTAQESVGADTHKSIASESKDDSNSPLEAKSKKSKKKHSPSISEVRPVLDAWAYGVEPENMDEIKSQLKGWGVDLRSLSQEIDKALDLAAIKVAGS